MTMHFRSLAVLVVALAAVFAYSPLARADTITSEQAYKDIKDAERGMPVPTPIQSVNVGTFNAATGEFEGLTTETEIINGKPVKIVPSVLVNAVNTKLVFAIRNSTQLTRVSVQGVGSTFVAAGRTSASIDVGRIRSATWSITSGLKKHFDQLTIRRPTFIGAGAFTIPALPVAVVYDPPQDPTHSNSVVFTRTQSVATTLGLSVRKSTSTTAPAVNPTFAALGNFQQALTGASAFAKAAHNDVIASVLDTINSKLGSAQRNVTTAEDNTSTVRRSFTFSEARGCSLDAGQPHLGPGHSDIVVYLRNVRVVWFDDGTNTKLLVLGTGPRDCVTIDQLRSGVADLDPRAAAGLIALDPFAGPFGPRAPLATDPRYVGLEGIGLLPGILNRAIYTQQLLVENSHVETSTRVVTDDLSAGLLSIIGIGPSETQQVSSTLAVTTSADTTESTTVSTELTARTLVDGVRTELAVFFDRSFGTVAFQDATQ
jgi:hypothetical protein